MGFVGMDYKNVCMQESMGRGSFGVKIDIAGSIVPDDLGDFDNEEYRKLNRVLRKAAESVEKAFRRYHLSKDPGTKVATEKNRKMIDDIFSEIISGFIFVEEIPNEYCKDYCCEHLPWFIVTTSVGRFKIGWRKRVIEIDWSDTVEGTQFADHLFGDENVTMGNKYIHAWSIEDAKRYVEKVLMTVL